ncbi:MAG: 2-amino-4-hydroxy-6-hydroxymethyldihydropteridine diphosphokinase [Balneolaceae bacterium]
MAKVIVAAGSNLGDRRGYLEQAGEFLSSLSGFPLRKSSVWESEPVGPAEFSFLNTTALIETEQRPADLLSELKRFEQKLGRDANPKRWGPRILDLDIISYNNLVIKSDTLIIPHPEYQYRLFVLLPMKELLPEWTDPLSGKSIRTMIKNAPDLQIEKTDHSW